MKHITYSTIISLFVIFFLSACSGSGSTSSNEGSSSSPENTPPSTGSTGSGGGGSSSDPDGFKNVVSALGGTVSQSPLTTTLDSITTGSGQVLTNIGQVVTSLGDGLPLEDGQLTVDDSYVTTALQGASKASTGLGTTVVSAGSAVSSIDALPLFVQLENETGVLSFTGGSISNLGGSVESVGEWLEFQFSKDGGLYGTSEAVSVITAPLLVQTGDLIGIAGRAAVLIEDLGGNGQTLPEAVYVSASELKQGTVALLLNADGTVNNLGTVFVGEGGLTALVLDEASNNIESLSASTTLLLDNIVGKELTSSDLELITDATFDSVTLVTNTLSDTLTLDGGLLSLTNPDFGLLSLSTDTSAELLEILEVTLDLDADVVTSITSITDSLNDSALTETIDSITTTTDSVLDSPSLSDVIGSDSSGTGDLVDSSTNLIEETINTAEDQLGGVTSETGDLLGDTTGSVADIGGSLGL